MSVSELHKVTRENKGTSFLRTNTFSHLHLIIKRTQTAFPFINKIFPFGFSKEIIQTPSNRFIQSESRTSPTIPDHLWLFKRGTTKKCVQWMDFNFKSFRGVFRNATYSREFVGDYWCFDSSYLLLIMIMDCVRL